MKVRLVVPAALASLGAAMAFVVTAEPIVEARAAAPVVFVCRNGVSMSVWSAAYFNRLAAARDLRERAVARALIPSFTDVPFRMAFALALDGFRLAGYRPRVVSAEEARSAELRGQKRGHVFREVHVDGRDDQIRRRNFVRRPGSAKHQEGVSYGTFRIASLEAQVGHGQL